MIDEVKLNELKIKAIENNVPIIQDEALRKIEKILEEVKPNTILEIGTAVGYSALCFSKYLRGENSKIITVELKERLVIEARENIKNISDENNIKVVHSDAEEFMKSLNETFDVVFIDAAKGQYMKYLEEALRLTKEGSYIIADNILFKGRVRGGYNEHKHRTAVTRLREYIDAVESNKNLETNIIDIGDGIAVSKVLGE